jgi:hypothetical protein
MTGIIVFTIAIFAVLMGIMAVGLIFQKKSLRGSCGGSAVFDCDGNSISCDSCPNRPDNASGGTPKRVPTFLSELRR